MTRSMPHKRKHLMQTTVLCALGFSAIFTLNLAPAAAQSAPSEFNLTPAPLKNIGESLAAEGITLDSEYNGEFAANPSGGERQGADIAGEFNIYTNFDLGKIVGLQGGAVHVLFTDRAGNNLAANSINNSVSVQQIYGGGQTYQLTTLAYEQALFNDKIDAVVGRIDLGRDFIVSPLYCQFQSNAICANPNMMGRTTSTSFPPVAVWGGRVTFNPTPNLYLKTGAYQSAPAINPDYHHGFDWSTSNSNGFLLPIEAGYTNTLPGVTIPDQYDAGVIFDRTDYSAPYYSTSQAQQYGRALVYLQAEKLVYQVEPNSPRGLYLFGAALSAASGGRQVANFSVDGGAVFQGPIASRPLDSIGLAVSDIHYNNRYLNSLYQIRLAEGGTQHPDQNMMMLELHYAAQLTPWLNLMPNFQYIVNPDGQGGVLNYPAANENNAVVVGLQFVVDPAIFLGLAGF
jgi:porin